MFSDGCAWSEIPRDRFFKFLPMKRIMYFWNRRSWINSFTCIACCTVDWILNLLECFLHSAETPCRQCCSRLLWQYPVTRDNRLRAMDPTHCYLFSNISQTFHSVHVSQSLPWAGLLKGHQYDNADPELLEEHTIYHSRLHQSRVGWCGLQMVVNKPCRYFSVTYIDFSYLFFS